MILDSIFTILFRSNMSQIANTAIKSLEELLGSSIKMLPAIIIALVIIMLTRYAAEFALNTAKRIGKRTIKSKSLQSLLHKTAYVGAWTFGTIFACVVAFPGLSLGNIVATLGLSSVAIGFAFQDIFKNFLSGILILIQEPFSIDDQIIIDDYEGIVEQINIHSTRIRTYKGEIVLMPNSNVFTSPVQVRTAYSFRRTDLAVGVDYNTTLPKAKDILQQTIEKVEGVSDTKSPEIDLVDFGDSSIDFVVRYWTSSRQSHVRQVKTQAILSIREALSAAGIGIPYPIRTLYFYNQEQYEDNMLRNNSSNCDRHLD